MPPKTVRHTLWASALLGLLALASPAGASENVRVTVVAILATERDRDVDPRLRCVAEEVRKRYPRLTGFHLPRMCCKSLEVGTRDDFDLVDGQKASITVQRGTDTHKRVRFEVVPPQMGQITYETACGKFLPIVTPVRTSEGDLLIIAVRVQPCRGK